MRLYLKTSVGIILKLGWIKHFIRLRLSTSTDKQDSIENIFQFIIKKLLDFKTKYGKLNSIQYEYQVFQ